MRIDEIIQFLETDIISVTFSPDGLKYLSLKNKDGNQLINLKKLKEQRKIDSNISLLINETTKFFESGSHNMPLDLQSFTAFQRLVFNEVSKIKPGEIYTYKEIGIKIGNPDAARAVGNVLAKNPVAYFIPSHRVLPKVGLGSCKSGAGFLREKLLILEGHDIEAFKRKWEKIRI